WQVLLSLRSPSALAVVDVPSRSVVWASKGVWQFQHDAQFLDSGRLLLFDNLGSPRGSRVLEYDPATQAIPWATSGHRTAPVTSICRGGTQRLPNGNTLLLSSGERRIVEVTKDHRAVWEWSCPAVPASATRPGLGEMLNLTGARRYSAAELTFLKGVSHARPN